MTESKHISWPNNSITNTLFIDNHTLFKEIANKVRDTVSNDLFQIHID